MSAYKNELPIIMTAPKDVNLSVVAPVFVRLNLCVRVFSFIVPCKVMCNASSFVWQVQGRMLTWFVMISHILSLCGVQTDQLPLYIFVSFPFIVRFSNADRLPH